MKMLLRSLNQSNQAIALLLLSMLALTFACERKPTAITPQVLEQFLKAVDAGSVKRDPTFLIDHMSPDALITVKMNGPNGPQILRINGKDYREKVKSELSVLTDYKYQRSETKFEISKDQQQARVTMKTSEMMTAPNGVYRAETKQTCLYVLRGGKLMIQTVDSESTAARIK